ncbi:MAG: thermonuclease family protein [Gemmatimonadales bacterium]
MPIRPLILLAALAACRATRLPAVQSATDPCVVERVTDGDTLRCTDGRRVRLIGIDAPEREQGGYERSRDGLLRLARPGSTVRLEHDVTALDRYGRTLAYVWVGDTLVNELMVREGWAFLYTVPPNVRHEERLRDAQRAARDAGAGLWEGDGAACLPSEFRRGNCP